MSMYKRPPLRVRDSVTRSPKHNKAPVGSFIHKLLNPPPTVYYERVKQPVYQKEAYLALLKKNHEVRGIEWVEPEIPDYEPPQTIEKPKEPELTYIDKVYLNLRILKSGIVRVKLNTSFSSLYEKYYSKNKIPPIKTVIQAYKSHGFSDKFLELVKISYEKRLAHAKKVSKAIDTIFNKEPAKKTKKKKEEEPKPEPEEENNNDEEEQDQEDDGPEEDEALDVEVDEDIEEQQEEEYFSDGGD
jgi:hypothetical protein